MKMTFLLVSISLLSSLASASGEIACKGVDGAGNNVIVNMTNISGTGYGYAFGVLQATTVAGVNTIDARASLVGSAGKVEDESIGFSKDLYIEAKGVFLNLGKSGRQQYQGELCGPHNKINVAGIQFTSNDCIQVACVSKGLSTLK